MPSISHPLRSLRLALALAVVCGLSFTGWRVHASETNGNWLLRLKHVPAAVWAAVFPVNPETARNSGVATDGNDRREIGAGGRRRIRKEYRHAAVELWQQAGHPAAFRGVAG